MTKIRQSGQKNKTTGAVLEVRTAPAVWDIGRGQEIPAGKKFRKS